MLDGFPSGSGVDDYVHGLSVQIMLENFTSGDEEAQFFINILQKKGLSVNQQVCLVSKLQSFAVYGLISQDIFFKRIKKGENPIDILWAINNIFEISSKVKIIVRERLEPVSIEEKIRDILGTKDEGKE